jgi:hypothetical protein
MVNVDPAAAMLVQLAIARPVSRVQTSLLELGHRETTPNGAAKVRPSGVGVTSEYLIALALIGITLRGRRIPSGV